MKRIRFVNRTENKKRRVEALSVPKKSDPLHSKRVFVGADEDSD